MKINERGFTLIELIMVIIILGIIASVTLPKFVNFKATAFDKQEDYVIGALSAAIKMKFTENITKGSEPDNAWPSGNFFTLLAQAPPNYTTLSFNPNSNDNVNWRIGTWGEGDGIENIYCPHWDGPTAGAYGTRGRRYICRFGASTGYAGWPLGTPVLGYPTQARH